MLYNELADHTNEEKAEMADDFAEEYEGRVQELIAFFSDASLAAPGSFKETWAYIAEGNHSLERCSNLKLLFQ